MHPCMKLRYLEGWLQGFEDFAKPKIGLEQYVTPPHLGSHILFTIQSQYGDITDKMVADLGSGCGALALGACKLEAAHVVGFEIDGDAIEACWRNVEDCDFPQVDLVQCDVVELPRCERYRGAFDTVVMNPPFGTKQNSGIDVKFLESAFHLSNNAVYSLHKTSTRQHVLKQVERLGGKGEVLAQLVYDLPATYRFHKKKSVDVEVDFVRIEVDP